MVDLSAVHGIRSMDADATLALAKCAVSGDISYLPDARDFHRLFAVISKYHPWHGKHRWLFHPLAGAYWGVHRMFIGVASVCATNGEVALWWTVVLAAEAARLGAFAPSTRPGARRWCGSQVECLKRKLQVLLPIA